MSLCQSLIVCLHARIGLSHVLNSFLTFTEEPGILRHHHFNGICTHEDGVIGFALLSFHLSPETLLSPGHV